MPETFNLHDLSIPTPLFIEFLPIFLSLFSLVLAASHFMRDKRMEEDCNSIVAAAKRDEVLIARLRERSRRQEAVIKGLRDQLQRNQGAGVVDALPGYVEFANGTAGAKDTGGVGMRMWC